MTEDGQKLFYTTFSIKGIGFTVYASEQGIIKIGLNEKPLKTLFPNRLKLKERDPYLFGAADQLREYFHDGRKKFDVPLDLRGTEFQKKVWKQLSKIAFGKVCSYIDVARKLGNSKLTRAVGRANGANPVPIIIPCHRVIYSNGQLGGYSGGLEIKKILLELEGSLSLELFN